MRMGRSSMRRYDLVAALAICVWAAAVVHAQTHGLGRPLSAEEIRKYDALIPPSGAGLPVGSGTAEKGKAIYATQCARCHGATGREGPEDVLVGGIGTLATAKPEKTVGSYWPHATTLWDYLNRAMPFDRPGVLSPDDVYAVTAYVLHLNGIVSATDVLDANTLPKIRMPNRDGFIPDRRPDTGRKRGASWRLPGSPDRYASIPFAKHVHKPRPPPRQSPGSLSSVFPAQRTLSTGRRVTISGPSRPRYRRAARVDHGRAAAH